MVKVNYRNGFSDRNKINEINKQIQTNYLDERTRNRLLNLLSKYYNLIPFIKKQDFINKLYDIAFAAKIDYISDDYCFNQYIMPVILENPYDEVLSLLEFFENYLPIEIYYSNHQFHDAINALFEIEYVGYRFVNEIICPITNPIEINTIEEAIVNNPYEPCARHINQALIILSKDHDYSNSIKESISAVESICQIITGNDNATLGDCLKILQQNNTIHPALVEAFKKLYGYTSNANGIRHANGLGEGISTQEEAQFMLVSCSAFINYIISLQSHN